MAYATIATGAVSAVQALPASQKEAILRTLSKATKGLIRGPEDIVSYVSKDPDRARIVSTNLAGAGVNPSAFFAGVDLTKEPLRQMFAESQRLFAAISHEVDARGLTSAGTQQDKVRAAVVTRANNERVSVALGIFGTPERYAACQGLTSEDFAAYAHATGRRR